MRAIHIPTWLYERLAAYAELEGISPIEALDRLVTAAIDECTISERFAHVARGLDDDKADRERDAAEEFGC